MKSHYQLIVAGGGFAGTCAALAAAKRGVDVLLIERTNCLGGAACNALVTPFMNWSTYDASLGGKRHLCGNLFLEILDEINALLGVPEKTYRNEFDEEALKLVLNRMCLRHGVQLLYNTSVTAADASGGRIRSVTVMSRGLSATFSGDYFIDATGDAELSVLAGCPFQLGREEDGLCQPMTLCFRVAGIDRDVFFQHWQGINDIYKDHKARGLIQNPREDVLLFDTFHKDVFHFNTTRIIKRNPTDMFDVTQAEIDAREQVFEIHKFMKENIPGCENARILSTALQIGIRESRRVEGEYILNVEDLKSLARFEDAIATANYDIDIHNPAGSGTSHYFFGPGKWYEIPYRCLVPKHTDNLLVAGRCISSTHEAQASYRIMPFCAELGQAAGTAVAVAAANRTSTRDVDVQQVRSILRSEGFSI